MPKSLTLTPADVRAAKGRDEWVVFLPVTPEPAGELVFVSGDAPHGRQYADVWVESGGGYDAIRRCPLGKPGDEVVGREVYGFGWNNGHGGYSALRPTGQQHERPDRVFYKADGQFDDESQGKYPWKPARSMPLWASRFRWTVSAVSVVRIQDVGEADAIAYGAPCIDNPDFDADDPCDDKPQTHLAGFREMWSARYSPEQWERNVPCWRVGLTLTPARAGWE